MRDGQHLPAVPPKSWYPASAEDAAQLASVNCHQQSVTGTLYLILFCIVVSLLMYILYDYQLLVNFCLLRCQYTVPQPSTDHTSKMQKATVSSWSLQQLQQQQQHDRLPMS